jgi:hypothetical protein
VTQVRGYADQMLRVKNNPTDPSNRRISILVKNDTETAPDFSAAKVMDGSTPLPGIGKGASASASSKGASNGGNALVDPGSPGAVPAAGSAAKPATAVTKPVAGAPAAKAGMMDRLKSLMPGGKK